MYCPLKGFLMQQVVFLFFSSPLLAELFDKAGGSKKIDTLAFTGGEFPLNLNPLHRQYFLLSFPPVQFFVFLIGGQYEVDRAAGVLCRHSA